MPRQTRLDGPVALHHVMGRGIDGTKVFQEDTDRDDFVTRLAALGRERRLVVYAWALMPNHFHVLVRTGQVPLAQSMQKLLTGYVVNFNRRHRRVGHLFQNRYKSIVVEEDPYLLELVRYLHLNPLRGGLLRRLADLRRDPWTGNSAILGTVARDWQDTATIRACFGRQPRRAIARYEAFVREGSRTGGGLLRSVGGWAQVLARRRTGSKVAADARILGSGEFIDQFRAEAARREKETLRRSRKRVALGTLAKQIASEAGGMEAELRSGSRQRGVVRTRRVFCQVAVKGMGYSGAAVARFLGVTTSSVNRLAVSDELPEAKRYRKAI